MEKKLSSKKVFDGHLLKVYQDDVLCYNNKISVREYIKHPGGVCILGFVNDKVIIEKQFRYSYNEEIFELPAGKLEKGEDPLSAAKREFEEETGYKVLSIISLGSMYPSCGYTDEVIHLYYANEIEISKTNLDDDEEINIEFIPLEKVIEMIDQNIIKDAKTICLIDKFLRLK